MWDDDDDDDVVVVVVVVQVLYQTLTGLKKDLSGVQTVRSLHALFDASVSLA